MFPSPKSQSLLEKSASLLQPRAVDTHTLTLTSQRQRGSGGWGSKAPVQVTPGQLCSPRAAWEKSVPKPILPIGCIPGRLRAGPTGAISTLWLPGTREEGPFTVQGVRGCQLAGVAAGLKAVGREMTEIRKWAYSTQSRRDTCLSWKERNLPHKSTSFLPHVLFYT